MGPNNAPRPVSMLRAMAGAVAAADGYARVSGKVGVAAERVPRL